MKQHAIRVLAAVLLGGAVFVLAGSAARAAGPSDQPYLYTSKEAVSEAQMILQHLGLLAPGYQQGTLDDPTRAALGSFQISHTLRQTRLLDWETMNQLLPHRPGKDTDGDGVPDAIDKCPNTPKGAKVDAKGCPIDSDGDGVADGLDKCPNTAKGVKVDREGCPMDSDRDGVFDGLDKCPGTPKGVKVDTNGCVLDSDGDGVTDDKDKCPDTPKGSKVDANGCPPPAPAPVFAPGKVTLVLEGVNFDTNSAKLKPESSAVLDKVAESLKANGDVRVEVGGHTDSTGSKARNAALSKDRARSVVDYLVGKGVSPARLESKGYGPTQPIADNKTAEGRARNRRVELKKLD